MKQHIDIGRLVNIMDELREKCPWDRKQTIHTLRQQTIEETFELVDAITDSDWKSIKEELGDLLLHIVFYSKIGQEQNQFDLQQVIDTVSEKLIKRHPHIYGDVVADDEETVKKNWEQIKLAEGKKSVLSGVPKSLPALVKAMRIQEKARQVGFEWAEKEAVWDKVEEEKRELEEALTEGNTDAVQKEAGDLLFSVINYIRFLKVDAENALELTNKKFINRFMLMEEAVQRSNRQLSEMNLAEMDEVWNAVKKENPGN
jgi:MazG family protein